MRTGARRSPGPAHPPGPGGISGNGPDRGGTSLLGSLPGGRLLGALLHLGLSADRRDEFLGDLIEEANLRLARGTRRQIAGWVWSQVIGSLPGLIGLRLRRLLAGARTGGARRLAGSAGGRGAGLLAMSPSPFRTGQRHWPLPLALSVSVHALLVAAGLGWGFAQVEEIKPVVMAPLEILATHAGDPEVTAPEPEAAPASLRPVSGPTVQTIARPAAPPLARRARPPRRPAPALSVLPSPVPLPGPIPPGAGVPSRPALAMTPLSDAAPVGEGPRSVALPPQVAEKRCLACPPPQLTPPYARLAGGQQMLVRTCVNVRGQVTSVDVLQSFDSNVDREVVSTIRHWRLEPYRLNGHPVPFCYATRFLFTSH